MPTSRRAGCRTRWPGSRSAAGPGHVDAVRAALSGLLTDQQRDVLGEALQAVLDELDPDHGGRAERGADVEV